MWGELDHGLQLSIGDAPVDRFLQSDGEWLGGSKAEISAGGLARACPTGGKSVANFIETELGRTPVKTARELTEGAYRIGDGGNDGDDGSKPAAEHFFEHVAEFGIGGIFGGDGEIAAL